MTRSKCRFIWGVGYWGGEQILPHLWTPFTNCFRHPNGSLGAAIHLLFFNARPTGLRFRKQCWLKRAAFKKHTHSAACERRELPIGCKGVDLDETSQVTPFHEVHGSCFSPDNRTGRTSFYSTEGSPYVCRCRKKKMQAQSRPKKHSLQLFLPLKLQEWKKNLQHDCDPLACFQYKHQQWRGYGFQFATDMQNKHLESWFSG